MLNHIWILAALFNWGNESNYLSFTTEELGVDSEPEYVLYEFWTRKSLGAMKGNFSMNVPAHSVRLLSMHKTKTFPQWISSDRHVAQNAMELKEYEWKPESHTLEGKIQLIGTFPLTMFLHVPEDYYYKQVECAGVKCSADLEANNILAITFKTDKTGDYWFKINF